MKVFVATIFTVLALTSCNKKKDTTIPLQESTTIVNHSQQSNTTEETHLLSKNFKAYWYAGEAEISSYSLEQYRYGELRKGEAVLIYVTEPFLKDAQVKANKKSANSIPVLKLNTTKNFVTGIYPYSIMQSVFFPVKNNEHAIKASASIQEWCGQAYAQVNNRTTFEITAHSYFEGEADQKFMIEKAVLENELWTQLRIDPKSLPTGTFNCVPSLEFTRLYHKEIKAYKAEGRLENNTYTLKYLDLDRVLKIEFENSFPFKIKKWEDTYQGKTSTGILKTSLKSNYWSKNTNNDVFLREILQLK